MTLWEELRAKMEAHPRQTVDAGARRLTYAEVIGLAEKQAEELRGKQCCALFCHSELNAAIALLACFAAGVTALPLPARYGMTHCHGMLNTVLPDAVICDEGGGAHVKPFLHGQYVPPEVHPALIMCTSGTTGKPKGSILTERNILTNVRDIAEYFGITPDDRVLIARPLYHCAVLTGEFLTALVRGSAVCFYSGELNPAALLREISAREITVLGGTPTLLSMMARMSHRRPVTALRHVAVSGECLTAQNARILRACFPAARIYHVYGLTEACPRVAYLPPDLFSKYPEYVGIPLKSVSVKIVKKDGREAQAGETGMLYVRGGNVMAGYYRDPETTKRVLRDGWLCTGDLAQKNEAGYLRIMGRADDLIIRAGMNIFPSEIENALKRDRRVHDAVAYAVPHRFGTRIGLRISGDFADVAEVKRLCVQCLPSFQVPSEIELLDSLPRTCTGKVIRHA